MDAHPDAGADLGQGREVLHAHGPGNRKQLFSLGAEPGVRAPGDSSGRSASRVGGPQHERRAVVRDEVRLGRRGELEQHVDETLDRWDLA